MSKPRMCPHCRAFIDPKEKICPYCEEALPLAARDRADPGTALQGLIPSTHFTTFIILMINFGVFVAMILLSHKVDSSALWNVDTRVAVLFGAMWRYSIVVDGEWWRLITAGFLHGGVIHILMNSYFLFMFAPRVEETLGTPRFLVIYFASTIGGFWLSMMLGVRPSLGASAAICGLIGAMMAYAKRSFQSQLWKSLMGYVIFIAIWGFIFPGIDNAAHLGGFAAGYGVGWVAASPAFGRTVESMWRSAAIASCFITLVAFAFAYVDISRAF